MTMEVMQDFINEHVYDVRITRNGRWIDQKCTNDVVCLVADCIVDYLQNGGQQPFESPAIWKSAYASKSVSQFFGKPDTLDFSAHDEFNKFFRQPMKMLAAAGVLKENGKKNNAIQFSVANRELLEFVALRERNAYSFLCSYIEKTLSDSGLWLSFKRFFDGQTKSEFEKLKERYAEFSINNTPIRTKTEAYRIFTKVLNTLACKYHKKGTFHGSLSLTAINFSDICYNRLNWRDELSGKEKSIARKDFKKESKPNESYLDYRINRAIKNLRLFNDKYYGGKSEYMDELGIAANATHIHHIFPKHQFALIADYVENLIALTAAQHMQKAHPAGNTQVISKDYQYLLLMAKIAKIKANILHGEGTPAFYNFNDFIHVLAVGFADPTIERIADNDFERAINAIESNY